MATGVFVTGTDTGVGKTVVAVALLAALRDADVPAIGMKPVSAGIDPVSGRNPDVDALAAVSGVDAPLAERNPFALRDPVAPHLAARSEERAIDLRAIGEAYGRLAARAEAVVVEGAGGPLGPLDDRLDRHDIARTLSLPAVLVVGLRLGCLSHARAATLAIRARGVPLAGWIATRIEPGMPFADENVAWLLREIAAPLLADLATPRDRVPREALFALGLTDGRGKRA